VPTESVSDPQKAAAIREFIKFWARSEVWIEQHPREWIDGYYVKDQGLTRADGAYLVKQNGQVDIPDDWTQARFAVTAAWLALAVVEQVNATSGIGYMMGLARTYGQTDIIIVGLVVYGLLGLLSDGLVRLVERKVWSWRRTLAD
jgi:hypothetical protein